MSEEIEKTEIQKLKEKKVSTLQKINANLGLLHLQPQEEEQDD